MKSQRCYCIWGGFLLDSLDTLDRESTSLYSLELCFKIIDNETDDFIEPKRIIQEKRIKTGYVQYWLDSGNSVLDF